MFLAIDRALYLLDVEKVNARSYILARRELYAHACVLQKTDAPVVDPGVDARNRKLASSYPNAIRGPTLPGGILQPSIPVRSELVATLLRTALGTRSATRGSGYFRPEVPLPLPGPRLLEIRKIMRSS